MMDTKNSTVTQIYEIEHDYKIILAESIILPNPLLNNLLIKRGIIMMDERLEWSVLGFKEIRDAKDISNFEKVVVPVFEGKLPSKPQGKTLTHV